MADQLPAPEPADTGPAGAEPDNTGAVIVADDAPTPAAMAEADNTPTAPGQAEAGEAEPEVPVADQLVTALEAADGGPLGWQALAEATGQSRPSVYRHMARLVKAGHVRPAPGGGWRLRTTDPTDPNGDGDPTA